MTNIYINLEIPKGKVEPKIFGHFCEHAFGNIYGGIYDCGDEEGKGAGIRKDVAEALKEVAPPILRYPGGNFVSNYHWEEGIGPKENRKKVFEYAWLTEESNQFGTADFIELCRMIGAEPLICVNMGTGMIEEAMHWVEYCNGTGDTYYANLRRSHGYEEPFCVKYWGLGNEMYGPWQMNTHTAGEYAHKAFEFAKAMKWVDCDIHLVACGYEQSADWNVTVIKKLWQVVDSISAHHYSCGWGPFDGRNYLETMCIADYMEKLHQLTCASILAGANDMCPIKVAWDEWNMNGWQIDGVDSDENYTLQNALVTALVLNMFIRNSNTISMAMYSTFVNISGALSVTKSGLVKRAQYPVFELLRHRTGSVLYDARVEGETFRMKLPKGEGLGRNKVNLDLSAHGEEEYGEIKDFPYIDAAVTGNEDGTVYVSLVNKDEKEDRQVCLNFIKRYGELEYVKAYTIYGENIYDCNTKTCPERIKVRENQVQVLGEQGKTVLLKKHSVNVLVYRPADRVRG